MTKGGEALNKAYGHKGKKYAEIDCSNLVHRAFEDAGYKYTYCTTSQIPNSDAFTQIGLGSAQRGDIILFDGHMGFIESCELKEDGEFKGSFLEVKVRLVQRVQPLAQPKDLIREKTKKFEGCTVRNDSLMKSTKSKILLKKLESIIIKI